jgi:4,5-dihydroxyphthalate decarboxylase
MTALDTAKAHAQHPSDISVALPVMLPWLAEHVTETRRVMGDDYWPYGLEPNHHVLSTFLRYASAQGIASAELTPEQLFAPETLSTAKV